MMIIFRLKPMIASLHEFFVVKISCDIKTDVNNKLKQLPIPNQKFNRVRSNVVMLSMFTLDKFAKFIQLISFRFLIAIESIDFLYEIGTFEMFFSSNLAGY